MKSWPAVMPLVAKAFFSAVASALKYCFAIHWAISCPWPDIYKYPPNAKTKARMMVTMVYVVVDAERSVASALAEADAAADEAALDADDADDEAVLESFEAELDAALVAEEAIDEALEDFAIMIANEELEDCSWSSSISDSHLKSQKDD